ncbi:MAG: TonB-dependent receptor, partial [Gammaproteobacteria bacterium]|nr:TonB-dependent receptor [Gammaproteobacteria bacterium]
GGAINIITRKTGGMNFNASAGIGSYDHQHQTINAANRFSNGLGIRLSAERRLSDNYRNQNRIDYDNLFLNVSQEWQAGSVFAELIHVDEDLQTPGAIFPQQIQVSRKVIGPFSLGDFNDTVSDTGRLGGNIRLAPDWELAVEYTHRNEDVDGLISGTEFNQHRLARSFNPRLYGNLPFDFGEISIVLGADIENTEYKLMSGVGDTVNDQDMQAIYTLLTWQLNPRLSFTGGVRYARLENDNFKRDPFAAFPLPVDTFVSKTNRDDQTAESLGVLFTPSDRLRFHVKRETSFRFPLSDELTGTLALFDDLETQTGVSWEAGAEWNSRFLTARAVAYRLDLDNEIAFDPALNLGVGANINLDSTRRNGLILELDYGLFDGLDAGVQYSWTDAGFEEGPFAGERIPMVAEHQLQFSSNYEFLPGWNLYGELILISDRVAAGDFANAFPELPGYGVTNLNLRYDSGRFSISARLNNVLDKKYSSLAATGFNPFIPGPFGFGGTDTGFFPAPERNFLFTIGYNYP